MAEYLIKTPLWTRDKTLYRPGRRNVSDAHAKELGLLKGDASEGGERGGRGEVPKASAATYPYPDLLAGAGFKDWQAVSEASDEDLLAVDGIGPARLKEIRDHRN